MTGPRGVEVAPDGSEVRPLVRTARASGAEFRLAAGAVSRAVRHRQVEEIWHVLSGRGLLWRRRAEDEELLALAPGVTLVLAPGTAFQFRASAAAPLRVFAVTVPPWPREGPGVPAEAVVVEGRWRPHLG